jgi:hypothetical protein
MVVKGRRKKFFGVLSVAVLIISVASIALLIYFDKNIDYEKDEVLFSLAHGSTETQYYCDVSENMGRNLQNYIPFESERAFYSIEKKEWYPLNEYPSYLKGGIV